MTGASLGLAAFAAFLDGDAAFAAPRRLPDPWEPHIKPGTSWDWSDHRANGYLGGQDYHRFALNDKIYAPLDGKLTIINSSLGHSRLTFNISLPRLLKAEAGESGSSLVALEFMHQNKFGPVGNYTEGEARPIGYVGNKGAGAVHLHVHGISNTGGRVDFRKFVIPNEH